MTVLTVDLDVLVLEPPPLPSFEGRRESLLLMCGNSLDSDFLMPSIWICTLPFSPQAVTDQSLEMPGLERSSSIVYSCSCPGRNSTAGTHLEPS